MVHSKKILKKYELFNFLKNPLTFFNLFKYPEIIFKYPEIIFKYPEINFILNPGINFLENYLALKTSVTVIL